MIPTLYASNELYYERHGLGKLFDTLSCIVHEEINGDYSMTFEYPVTGTFYKELLQEGRSVGVISPTDSEAILGAGILVKLELFDIYKYSKPINGVVTFYCNHFSRRLTRSVCYDDSLNNWGQANGNSSPKDYDGMSITGQGDSLPGTLVLTTPKSVLATLIGSEESVVSTIGGEFKFSSQTSSISQFPNDKAALVIRYSLSGIGEDRGAYIRFGKNMLDVLHERDETGAFNAVVPFWSSGAGGTIKYVTDYVVKPSTPISPVIAVPLDLSSDYQTEPTEAQMISAAQAYLDNNEPWKPTETITVDFAYDVVIEEGAQISLGDTVHVLWEDADIAADLRVVSYDYDVLTERYTKLELGTQQTQFVAVTGESYAGASGGGGGGTSGNIITYSSVDQLGLTVGSATLAGVWSALPVGSIIMSDFSEYASGERPSAAGVIVVEKAAARRGYIWAYGTYNYHYNYRMYLNSSNVPAGTWYRLYTEYDINTKIQTGQATTGSNGQASVTFPTTFAATPRVFCSVQGTSNNVFDARPANVSTTGFTIVCRYTSGSTPAAGASIPVNWLAVG